MQPFVKYLSEKHGTSFVERGEVLFRPLSYFRDLEDDDGVRSDDHEGTLVHRPENGLEATLVESGQKVKLPRHRFEATCKEEQILVYCASAALSGELGRKFNADLAIEVIDPLRWLALVRGALGLRPRVRANQLVHGRVKYYEWAEPPLADWAAPEKIAMAKPSSFRWQEEYRFAAPIGDAFRVENVSVSLVPIEIRRNARLPDHPMTLLKLGSLAKICRVHKVASL